MPLPTLLDLGINQTQQALLITLGDYLQRKLPIRRIVELLGLLLIAGSPPSSQSFSALISAILASRHSDGGWVDCEDTAWAVICLRYAQLKAEMGAGIAWLASETTQGAWGYSSRDNPCIPITGLILWQIPELRNETSLKWMKEAWGKDLVARYKLSYKAAWYLLSGPPLDDPLRAATLSFLLDDQRPSGAWGPWRDHPSHDDYFSTGIALAALAAHVRLSGSLESRVQRAFEAAIGWIKSTRRPDGLFPSHYIERGTAWVYFGETQAAACISEITG